MTNLYCITTVVINYLFTPFPERTTSYKTVDDVNIQTGKMSEGNDNDGKTTA